MRFHVITSFNEKYFNELGESCLNSLIAYWPREIPITCYVEGFRIDQYSTNRVNQVEFDQLSEYFSKFCEKFPKSKEEKFAKKAFSIIHAMNNIDCDVLIWIDSDTISHKEMTADFLESLITDKMSCHLGLRYTEIEGKAKFNAGDFYCCETGFFMLNMQHPKFAAFRDLYTAIYELKTPAHLRRFFDGDVHGFVMDRVTTPDEYNDINIENIRTCFNKSVIGEYMAHWKGKNAKKDRVPNR